MKEVMVKTKTNDQLSIKTREMTLTTMSKATAANLIAGNFAVDHAGSQSNESTSVNLSIFLPQTELTLVRDTDAIDLQARTENNMDMADSHKSKQSTDIRRIGTLKTSADVRSVLVNMLVLFTAVADGSLPLPILQQIVLNFLAFVTTVNGENGFRDVETKCRICTLKCTGQSKKYLSTSSTRQLSSPMSIL